MFATYVMIFFQAEDGIRDIGVTGVQTCALPISSRPPELAAAAPGPDDARDGLRDNRRGNPLLSWARGRARGAELGFDALPGPVLPDLGLVDGLLPRDGDLLRSPRLQPPRRRGPRSPGSPDLRLGRVR